MQLQQQLLSLHPSGKSVQPEPQKVLVESTDRLVGKNYRKVEMEIDMKLTPLLLCTSIALPAFGEESADTSSRTPAAAITWVTTSIGPDAASISGDFSTGRHVTYLRFPAGVKTPVHIHSAGYTGIVVAGVARHYVPGTPASELDLAAGSFWSMPANLPHISECLPGADCIFALIQDEALDYIPQE